MAGCRYDLFTSQIALEGMHLLRWQQATEVRITVDVGIGIAYARLLLFMGVLQK
jgi:hypothetical protein